MLLPPTVDPAPAPPLDALAPVDPGLQAARNLLNLWLADSKTDATRRTYRAALDDFRLFLSEPTPAHAIARLLAAGKLSATAIIETYRAVLLAGLPATDRRALAPATVNLRISAVLSVLGKAYDLDLIGWLPRVRIVKTESLRDTRGPGVDAINRMYVLLADRHDDAGCRDRAILRLLFDLGLRRAEVVGLDREHVSDDGRLWVLGKGRSERHWSTLPLATQAAITDWLARRGDHPGPLFINLSNRGYGGRLTGASVHRLVATLGKRVGVRVWPHGIRHTSITAALDATQGDVRSVQKHSRHRSLDVLIKYDDARQDTAGRLAGMVSAMMGG